MEIGVTILVVGPLSFMNSAIHLNDELERMAIEISHIGPDRNLAAELEAEELPIAQPLP